MKYHQRMFQAAGVVLAAGLIGAVGYFATCSMLIRGGPEFAKYVSWCWSAIIGTMVVFTLLAIWKQMRGVFLVPIILLNGLFVGYVVWDDHARAPRPDFGPTVAEEDPAYTAYCWYVEKDARCRLAEIPPEIAQLPLEPTDLAKMFEFVVQHREAYELAWEKDEIGRAWVAQMNASKVSGLFPFMKDSKSGLLSFAPIRDSTRACWGKAMLLLNDGNPNEAVRILLPRLRANYQLQKRGALLVTEMIAVVCLKGTYQRLVLIAQNSRLSNEVRKELIVCLQEATPTEEAIEKAFMGEQLFAWLSFNEDDSIGTLLVEYANRPDHPSLPNIPILRELLYQRNRTGREVIDFYRWVGEAAQQSRGKTVESLQEQFTRHIGPHRLANPYGYYLKQMSIDAFAKILIHFWVLEDQRIVLLTELEKP